MNVVKAVNELEYMDLGFASSTSRKNLVNVFLAGGITNCPDWQSEVIKELSQYPDTDDLVIYNPRRTTFDVNDPSASSQQIEWEFKHLSNMDIFSMYFASSKVSPQPICFYELGRHLAEMKRRFPETVKKRIVLGVEDDFIRHVDVKIQTSLALNENMLRHLSSSPKEHARKIYEAYQWVKKFRELTSE